MNYLFTEKRSGNLPSLITGLLLTLGFPPIYQAKVVA